MLEPTEYTEYTEKDKNKNSGGTNNRSGEVAKSKE